MLACGAAAAALWMTLRALPLDPDEGLGASLTAGLRAARRWAQLIAEAPQLEVLQPPELDILAFHPSSAERTASAVDRASQALFEAAAADGVHLSVLRVPAARLTDHDADVPDARILRSVLMKPEHERRVDELHERLLALSRTEAS